MGRFKTNKAKLLFKMDNDSKIWFLGVISLRIEDRVEKENGKVSHIKGNLGSFPIKLPDFIDDRHIAYPHAANIRLDN